MTEGLRVSERLAFISPGNRTLVLNELEAILSSYHFRGSKRYPALLSYVVNAALDGHSTDLKERTLGVEVFGRDPDYDTAADPVVRISAGEVRKRIAQYYHENGHPSPVRIELPLGSYIPEFEFRKAEAHADAADVDGVKPVEAQAGALKGKRRLLITLLGLGIVMLAAGAYAIVSYLGNAPAGLSVQDQFWGPFVNSPGQAVIVIGLTRPDSLPPATSKTSFEENNNIPYHHVSMATSIAMTHVAAELRTHGKFYEIKDAPDTSLTDIHYHPLVLIGGRNNEWTLRLVAPLRFHIQTVPMPQIQDSQNPQNTQWTVDVSQPYTSVTTDYALVARYYDSTTEAPVVVIAGLGPYGTEAASEFVDSPEYLAQIAKKVPAGWEKRNLELILKTQVIGDQAGPPVLISAFTW
ncbi:MAG: hypothetical protein ACLQG3_04085 [Terracidiphilus sp.]